MAIQTGGFQVGVMPQYTPVNPALATLNPNQATQGALAGLQLAQTLEQLRAEREHNEEFAKTHLARVKMAEAQSALEVLKLDHANAVRQSKIDAEIAEHKLKVALAPSEEKKTIAGNELSAATSTAAMPNVAPAAALAGLQIGSDTKNLQFLETQRPVVEAAKVAQAEIANQTAQFNLDTLPEQQAVIRAKLADELKNAKTDQEIKRAHDRADTELKLAQAKNYLAMTTGDGRYDKDPMAAYARLENIENQLIRKEQSILRSAVIMPNGKPGILSDYIAATREVGGGDKTQRKIANLFWATNVPRNQEAEDLIADLQGLRSRRAKLSSEIAEVDLIGKQAPGAQPATPSTVLTPEQARQKQSETPEGVEFTFIDSNGVTRKGKGTKKN